MLPIDHLPFHSRDLDALAKGFEAMGFKLSPRGAYLDDEGRSYANRCVFLARGWFDLIETPDVDYPATPSACLFHAERLEPALHRLAEAEPGRPFRLVRTWGAAWDLPRERFRWASLRQPVLPIASAVIEHGDPFVDVLPQWTDHPNGAVAIVGIAFAAPRRPLAVHLERELDLAGFRYLDEAFTQNYGGTVRTVVRVRVRSLERARQALADGGVRIRRGPGLVAAAQRPFDCAFEFIDQTR